MQKIDSHNNFFYFTASLVILLLASGYVSSTPDGNHHLVLQVLMFFTELVAYFSLSLSKKWRTFVVLILLMMAATTSMREFLHWQINPLVGLGVVLAFYAGMTYIAAKQVLFSGNIEPNSIIGALGVYLLMGIVWTTLYLISLEFWPEGINGIEHRDWHDNFGITAYFSYVTMTTLGFGDISPAVPMTRTLVYLQAVAGTFYMAVVVASLVGAFARKST